MAQVTSGIRGLLSSAAVYSGLMWAMGAQRARTILVEQFIRPRPGDAILDVGCGPADILAFLPPTVRYVGVDLSEDYIGSARATFGDRATFHCANVNDLPPLAVAGGYDIVVALGLLHHLDDGEVVGLLTAIRPLLKPGGRLVTLDNAFVDGQSGVARLLISMDRGNNVRQPEGYAALARQVFDDVSCSVRHDILRIPYTHAILECRAG